VKTIGQFYREKVLSQQGLTLKELPADGDVIAVEQDLFGWKLRIGRKSIPCRSEAEARFLAVLRDAGMTEIQVPDDDSYLAEILPALEKLKARVDEIIESYLDAVRDPQARETVRREVFAEITQ